MSADRKSEKGDPKNRAEGAYSLTIILLVVSVLVLIFSGRDEMNPFLYFWPIVFIPVLLYLPYSTVSVIAQTTKGDRARSLILRSWLIFLIAIAVSFGMEFVA